MTTDSDVLILGAGSAGLSAALVLARSRRRVLVLDGGPPRNAVTAHMHNVLGREGWSPLDLLETGRAEIEQYGARIERAQAVGVAREGDDVVVTLDDGSSRRARRLIVATGLRDELPPIPGLAERWGSGVAHCPFCDGWEARDSRIAVVSGGPASAHQAQLLRELSDRVTYFQEGTELPDDARDGLLARGIAIEPRRIAAVESTGDRIVGLRMADGDVVPADVVFVRSRTIPNDDVLRQLGAATASGPDGEPWVIVDPMGRTSVPGVWAAGNVVNQSATVAIAIAAGAMAGMAAHNDLLEHDIRAARERGGAAAA